MAAQRAITRASSIKSIVKDYKNGKSLSEIARKYEVAVTTIRNYLIAEDVQLRPRGARRTS